MVFFLVFAWYYTSQKQLEYQYDDLYDDYIALFPSCKTQKRCLLIRIYILTQDFIEILTSYPSTHLQTSPTVSNQNQQSWARTCWTCSTVAARLELWVPSFATFVSHFELHCHTIVLKIWNWFEYFVKWCVFFFFKIYLKFEQSSCQPLPNKKPYLRQPTLAQMLQ